MIDYQDQLKLQAFLDGELPETDARTMANRLARDQEAAALLTELRQTRQAVKGFEIGVTLPESREFYWSKIQREIQRRETPAPEPVSAVSLFGQLRRFLAPAVAVALLAILGVVITRQVAPSGGPSPAGIEVASAQSGAFTYCDYAAGATLVWVSYPADN